MEAALAGFVEAKQVENETADDGETGTGVFHASAHLVVVQRHIETPMDAILYRPMSAHDIGQRAGIGGNAADIEATLVAGLAVDGALRFDHPEHLQIGPLLRRREALQSAKCNPLHTTQSA